MNGYNVVYRSTAGSRPQIVGSIPVKDWAPSPGDPFIYRAPVPKGARSRQLYVNGKRATRARTTDYPEGFVPIYSKGGICFALSLLNDARWRDPAAWQQIQKVEAVLETQWKMMIVPLEAITQPVNAGPVDLAGILTLQSPAWENANLYLTELPGSGEPVPGIWSFWRVTRFENALAFLTDPGEWYLDGDEGWLYYKPRPGEFMPGGTVSVELPLLENLVVLNGSSGNPVTNIVFEGLGFSYATWLQPGGPEGYVSDQSGYMVMGEHHEPNLIGHVKTVNPTPGNISLRYAHNIVFSKNSLTHLGAVGIDLGTGCQYNNIDGNLFFDISSAAVQVGDVDSSDKPVPDEDIVSHNTVADNYIQSAAVEFVDAAGIFAGFTEYTTISGNTIKDVHWSGIAMGWGWGLLDPDGYPGLPGADWFQWGDKNYHTINRWNKIINNHIEQFLLTAWDGGAIYTTGYQGTGVEDALLIQGNTAVHKNPQLGGNVFYTDGGSRWIRLIDNTSTDNAVGKVWFGPAPKDPLAFLLYKDVSVLFLEYILSFLEKVTPYGGDIGGCRTYGDLEYIGNNGISTRFYNVCPYTYNGTSYPVNLLYDNNNDSSAGTVWGGANYPPINGVTGWRVPRVSLPGIMGMQPAYSSEWWFYAGVIYDDTDRPFSVLLNFLRAGSGSTQAAMGVLGIGWTTEGRSHSVHGLGLGIGAAQTTDGPSLLRSLAVQPVSDCDFGITFEPLIEFVQPYKNLHESGIQPNLSGSRWKAEYTGGNILGAIQSTYELSAAGLGYQTDADSGDTFSTVFALSLSLTAGMGMVMENQGGVVKSSYECALPVLQVGGGGRLALGDKEYRIKNGTFWLDRQMIAGELSSGNGPLSHENHLLAWYAGNHSQTGRAPLYIGNWMGITLFNGLSLVLTEFWATHPEQWRSGTGIGQKISDPLPGAFGNVYFGGSFDGADPGAAAAGGLFLRPRLSAAQGDQEWDYDINLLDTADGGVHSPHWTSPQTGITYCTAWHISFSPAGTVKGLPRDLYLFTIAENAEIVMSATNGHFEGAALIYRAPNGTGEVIGQAFVEQMGYN